MVDKNYEPEVVQDNPFPGEVIQPITSSPQATGVGNYSPTTTQEKIFPRKRIAVELLSTTLNTRSRKILEEFELQQSGGLKIGDFKEGISGDVRITPNGLTGRNNSGLTTFGLDTDGNLILVGEMRSGSVITGDITLEEGGSVEIGSGVVLDQYGLVSSTNFQKSNNIVTGLNQLIAAGSFTDVTSSSYNVVLPRVATVVFLFSVDVFLTESVGNTGNGEVDININGVDTSQIVLNSGNVNKLTLTCFDIRTLSAGTIPVKLRAFVAASAGAPTMTVVGFRSSYFVLGT